MSSFGEANDSIISLLENFYIIIESFYLRGAGKAESIFVLISKAHSVELILSLVVMDLLLHLLLASIGIGL